jgi:Na+-driven multidrug efflux pump
MCIGLATRIGQLLGEGRVQMAKRLTRASCLVAAGIIVVYSVIIFFTRTAIVGIFTSDATVLAETKTFWNYLSGFILLDSAW